MTSRSKPSQNQINQQNLQELTAQKDHLISGLQKKNIELTQAYSAATRKIQELNEENNKLREKVFTAESSNSILSRNYAEIIQSLNGSAPYIVNYFNNILKYCNNNGVNNKSAILCANNSKTENTTLKAITQTVKPHTVNGTVLNLTPTIPLARSAIVANIITSNNISSTSRNETESSLRSNSHVNLNVSGYQNENEENEEPIYGLEQDQTVSVLATSQIRNELSTILESTLESSNPQPNTNSKITIVLQRMSSEIIRAHCTSLNESMSEISTLVNASSTNLKELELSEADQTIVNRDLVSGVTARHPTSPIFTSTPNLRSSEILIPHMSALGDRSDILTASVSTRFVESPKSTKRKNVTNKNNEENSDDQINNSVGKDNNLTEKITVRERPKKKYKRIKTSLVNEMSVEDETDGRNSNRPTRAAKPKSLKEENLKK